MLNGYNQLVMHFIRPPRSDYDISQLGLFLTFNSTLTRRKRFYRQRLLNSSERS